MPTTSVTINVRCGNEPVVLNALGYVGYVFSAKIGVGKIDAVFRYIDNEEKRQVEQILENMSHVTKVTEKS